MSFNAKSLTYDSREPTFLQKLKSEFGGGNSDRHERPIARPRKQKDNDEDDEPAYVDEESHDTITKAQYHAMINPGDKQETEKTTGAVSVSTSVDTRVDDAQNSTLLGLPKKELVAGIGVSGKRRIAKVIPDNEEDTDIEKYEKNKNKNELSLEQKSAKKGKKVKLSFVEDGNNS